MASEGLQLTEGRVGRGGAELYFGLAVDGLAQGWRAHMVRRRGLRFASAGAYKINETKEHQWLDFSQPAGASSKSFALPKRIR